jgi:phage shock protein A
MQYVYEYRNVLKTDIKQLIDSSYDKSKILNAFIDQLEFRYIESNNNIKNLNEQKTVFMTNINNSNTQIETLKTKIQSDFQNNNSEESIKNLNKYLDLKKEYYYSRTYIIYINHFLTEFNYLNNYNKLLLDTLINNKEAIIKNAFIVIPDS